MDANNQNVGYEGTPTKKHAMEQSPRKLSPKRSKVEQQSQGTIGVRTGDKLDQTVVNLEARVLRLEKGGQKRTDLIQKKLSDQRAFLVSELDKKLDEDAAMDDEEHEKFITDIAKAATRAYLRKVLDGKVKQIVRDVIENILEGVIDGVIEGVVEGIIEEELATIRRTLEEQRGQLADIMDRIRTGS